MAHRTQELTHSATEWTDLAKNTWYSVQSRCNRNVYVVVDTSIPSNTDKAFVIQPMSFFQIKKTGNDKVYVWQDVFLNSDATGHLVYDTSN